MKNFELKYANMSRYVPGIKNAMPGYSGTLVGMIPFCTTESIQKLSKANTLACQLFQPFLTLKGLCYTFNSNTMAEIFHPDAIPESWTTVLNLKPNSSIQNPMGYGPAHGLNFVLNMFKPYQAFQTSKNVIMSISNENNGFDIFKQESQYNGIFTHANRLICYSKRGITFLYEKHTNLFHQHYVPMSTPKLPTI
jgi:hypothetical protein